jgi:hypothetical protein
MADTTTNLGWTIPTENANPWYAAFLSLMNEVDADVYAYRLFTGAPDTPSGYTTNGALYVANNTGSSIDESTVILTEAANTFAITKGSASLDIAAAATLNIDANLSVTTACTLDQDLQQSASPSFVALGLSGDLTLSGADAQIIATGHTTTSGIMANFVSTPGSASTAVIMQLEAQGSNWASGSAGLKIIADDADTKAIVCNNGAVDTVSISAWTGAISIGGNLTMGGNITMSSGGTILTTSNGDIWCAPHGTAKLVSDCPFSLLESLFTNITTVNVATYDLLISDYILHVTYTATAAVTSLTLPTAQTTVGRTIIVKDAGADASSNNITIDTEGSEKIDGADTLVLNTDYECVILYSDGSHWFTISV